MVMLVTMYGYSVSKICEGKKNIIDTTLTVGFPLLKILLFINYNELLFKGELEY